MYHLELRQFPHNFCRFNLTEQELREAILKAWAKGDWIELGERKWSPHQASLTVLEGPELSLAQLAMGRGWRNARRQGREVTEELLARARLAAGASPATRAGMETIANIGGATEREPADEDEVTFDTPVEPLTPVYVGLAADSLGLEVLAKLSVEPSPVAVAWHLAQARYPERPASDCLKLAEHAIRSLADARLVVVLAPNTRGEPEPCISAEQVERLLHAVGSWSSETSSPALIRRS